MFFLGVQACRFDDMRELRPWAVDGVGGQPGQPGKVQRLGLGPRRLVARSRNRICSLPATFRGGRSDACEASSAGPFYRSKHKQSRRPAFTAPASHAHPLLGCARRLKGI